MTFLLRDICVIIASTMVFLYYVFKGFIGEIWDKRSKEKEEEFKHERHMESAKLTRTREENKHLTQEQFLHVAKLILYVARLHVAKLILYRSINEIDALNL